MEVLDTILLFSAPNRDHEIFSIKPVQGNHLYSAVCDGCAFVFVDLVRIMCGSPRYKNEQRARYSNEHYKNECPGNTKMAGSGTSGRAAQALARSSGSITLLLVVHYIIIIIITS